MENIEREDIYIISKYSNLTEQEVDNVLKEKVYNDKEAWQKFLNIFVITLGVGFTVIGMVFFFAYNWADLHKFVKIGLVEMLIIATTIAVLLPKISTNISNIILMGASVLVGVLFAVFGQIYQTGANAYDFFLGWTVFITLWVLVSNFAPLWLFYVILINTTIILYSEQVARDWSDVFILTLLFAINSIVVIAASLYSEYKNSINIPDWFLNTVALASTTYATFGIVIGISEKNKNGSTEFSILILITSVAFALGIWKALRDKSIFYLAIIPFSIIVIVSALIIEGSNGETTFLLVSLFVAISVTVVVKKLIDIQKKWTNEK